MLQPLAKASPFHRFRHTMDPTLALQHSDTPALITLHAAVLPGMAAPTIIPLHA